MESNQKYRNNIIRGDTTGEENVKKDLEEDRLIGTRNKSTGSGRIVDSTQK